MTTFHYYTKQNANAPINTDFRNGLSGDLNNSDYPGRSRVKIGMRDFVIIVGERVEPGILKVGIVAIGRNEGERLRACLQSVIPRAALVVYVDSGSTDGSTVMARGSGGEVVELDMRIPFTAARARNEGFKRLRQLAPDLPYVHFVDGDCEVVGVWIETAAAFLDAHHDVAVVCGRRRERYPTQSIYNHLCNIEWDTPVGETSACGGDALMRVEAFEQVGGYRGDLIAGEEPELCVRLRAVRGMGRLTVADNGRGIPPAIQSRLFEAFQSDKAEAGNGLGVWISRTIVEKHGGHIRWRSCIHGRARGTTFTVWFPLEGPADGTGSEERAYATR